MYLGAIPREPADYERMMALANLLPVYKTDPGQPPVLGAVRERGQGVLGRVLVRADLYFCHFCYFPFQASAPF